MMYCEWCDKDIPRNDVEYRKEDNTFSAPFGDIKVIIGGYIDKVPVCPECGFDLEETE